MKNNSNYNIFHNVLRDVDNNIGTEEIINEIRRIFRYAILGELASGIIHEIINPINGIINYAQILKDQNSGSSEEIDILDRIINEGDRISITLRKLNSFARGEVGERVPIHPKNLILELINWANPLFRKKNIKVKTDIPDDLPWMEIELDKLQLVLLDIIFYAIEVLTKMVHVPEKSKILFITATVQELKENQVMAIAFLYSGIHAPLKLLDRLYAVTTPSGFGAKVDHPILPISESIMKELGGSISFEIEKDVYTKVIITYPLIRDQV